MYSLELMLCGIYIIHIKISFRVEILKNFCQQGIPPQAARLEEVQVYLIARVQRVSR